MNETLKLESALARLRTDTKIVLLHYAPIEGTVEGEPREIYPYWAAAVSKSRSAAMASRRSFTATRTTARLKDAHRRTFPCTTSRTR